MLLACHSKVEFRMISNFFKKLFRNFILCHKNEFLNKNKMHYFEGIIVRYLYDN